MKFSKNQYFLDETSSIGKNCKIYPGVVIEKNCKIGNNVTIQNATLISNNVIIGDNCFIGPFTVVRDKTKISKNCIVGPHSEIVRSELKEGSKIYHRTFIGDTKISNDVQVGCGTVIANSNFKEKFKSVIGEKTKIGANVTLIAPIRIGKNCFLAAGSIIAENLKNNFFYRLELEKNIKKN